MFPEPLISRHADLLDVASSRVLLIDVQERFIPGIPVADFLISKCRDLLRIAQVLDVPRFATVQYPGKLGHTIRDLAEFFEDVPEKMCFSGVECLGWPPAAEDDSGRDQVVIAGIETHICVLQTAYNLMAAGYRVYIVADAVASRTKLDWKFGLERLSAAGAIITTVEAIAFEWCVEAGTDRFKQVSKIITARG